MRYACIAVQSTAREKFWNNPKGWDEVVEHIQKRKFDVHCVDYHKDSAQCEFGWGQTMPAMAIDKTGMSLKTTARHIAKASFFVGLSSGLSWLAWAVKTPTVMISGFSEAYTEFPSPYRVINEQVCHGCFNDPALKFENKNFFWCPRKKDYECTREISTIMVTDAIDRLIEDHQL